MTGLQRYYPIRVITISYSDNSGQLDVTYRSEVMFH